MRRKRTWEDDGSYTYITSNKAKGGIWNEGTTGFKDHRNSMFEEMVNSPYMELRGQG